MITFLVLTCVTFSLFGFIIGIWAKNFEQLNLVPLLIVTPLVFLGGSLSIDSFLEINSAYFILSEGKILSSKSIIKIKNLNIKKRPISAVADNIEVRNVKKIVARINTKIKFRLIYDRNNSLIKKIKLEQIRKQTR